MGSLVLRPWVMAQREETGEKTPYEDAERLARMQETARTLASEKTIGEERRCNGRRDGGEVSDLWS